MVNIPDFNNVVRYEKAPRPLVFRDTLENPESGPSLWISGGGTRPMGHKVHRARRIIFYREWNRTGVVYWCDNMSSSALAWDPENGVPTDPQNFTLCERCEKRYQRANQQKA